MLRVTQVEARGLPTTKDTDADSRPLRPFIPDVLLTKGWGKGQVCKLINRGRPQLSVLVLLRHEGIYLLGKGFSHEQGKDQGGISIDLWRGLR